MIPADRHCPRPLSCGEIAELLSLELEGDASLSLHGVAQFDTASANDLCFIHSASYLKSMQDSHCQAVIVPRDFDCSLTDKTLLLSANPHLSFVQAIDLIWPLKQPTAGIDASASIDPSAQLGEQVSIGAHAVIEADVQIAQGTVIGAGCFVGRASRIGRHCQLHANVTICHDSFIGDEVILHPGVVIGGDGFGLVHDQGDWVKIPQIGRAVLGDRVEIGCNTTVDRGALGDTVLANGVKLDNLIQVAHNVQIGENTAMAACGGIAGSTKIGKNCRISGACVILGHLEITDNVTVTASSMVTKSIKKSGTYSSGTPLMENRLWHRNAIRFKSLDSMAKQLKELAKKTR